MIRMFRPFASIALLLALLPSVAFAQSAFSSFEDAKPADKPSVTPPAFDLADVHVSPHSNNPFMRGGNLRGDQFILRQGTMVDLIARAYGVEDDFVLGGPAWLDTDRFDILAKAPRTTSDDDIKLMLQALLKDRFNLVLHNDTKPLPAFVLTVGKGGPRMKESDGTASSGCGDTPSAPATPSGAVPYNYVSCHNLTADQIAENLHDMAGGYLTNNVVNSTGLKGSWDFDIHWTSRGNLQKAGDDGISIFDAVDKQLGLKLEAKTAPLPVLVVDSVNRIPSPNAPGIDKALPPPPPPEFDVAVITPSNPDKTNLQGRITNNQLDLTGATLQFLITWSWDLNPNDKEALMGAPKWLDQDHYDILAKVAPDPQAKPGTPQIDFDELQLMMRKLLAERFNLKSHMEEHPADAYTLVAVNPKLKKADPLSRTGCKEGPGPDGKDPRIANPILGRLLTCTNMTMAEFGDELRNLAGGYIFYPVLDSTGLDGGYDFTLSFSTAGQLQSTPPPPSNDPTAKNSDPNGGLSLFDAISKQMGLKMEKVRRPEPVLVIDHVDEKPTDN